MHLSHRVTDHVIRKIEELLKDFLREPVKWRLIGCMAGEGTANRNIISGMKTGPGCEVVKSLWTSLKAGVVRCYLFSGILLTVKNK